MEHPGSTPPTRPTPPADAPIHPPHDQFTAAPITAAPIAAAPIAARTRTRLVLASASPARLATLRRAGVEPTVIVSSVDEHVVLKDATIRYGALAAPDVALLLARAKCDDVAERLEARGSLVLGCDSVLEMDGEVHGRPNSVADAVERWHLMRGRGGVLHTGHWLRDQRDAPDAGAAAAACRPVSSVGATASTTVRFADLSDEEVETYVSTGEPLLVAGAFTLDGLGGAFVAGVEGDPHNVVGVSLPLLRNMLRDIGIAWTSLWQPDSPLSAG